MIERTRSLRKVAQQSDLLVNSVGDGIYGVDRDGVVTFVNPAAARVLGYPPHELIGREAHATFHDLQPDGSPFPVSTCYVTEAIQDQQTTSSEQDSYRRADGLSVPVEVTATPLIEDDRAIGAVVVFRDVTQRREVDRMKSEFVSMVSHELRTPLTAIRGSLGLIAGGALGELTAPAGRMVDIALVSSERLARLINEILDIERIESGMLSMDLGTHRARDLIELAVGQVQVIAEDAGVRVRLGRTDGEVYADADRVVQTLLNLLSNAIKFSHRGGQVLVEAEPRGGFVEFAIRDNGRGIPEDKLDSIFFRFEQVDSSDAREKGGSGLGLSISRSIVERLGGRIWAVNNSGPGATFLFTLPSAQDLGATEPVSTPYAEEPDEPHERSRRGGPLDLSATAENDLIGPPCNFIEDVDGSPSQVGGHSRRPRWQHHPASCTPLHLTHSLPVEADRRRSLVIRVSRGTGSGPTRLAAFDRALQDAGLADYNLIRLSSVIPPNAVVREVSSFDDAAGAHGDAAYCVYADAYASTPGEEAWAGVAWADHHDNTGAGLFVEHTASSEAILRRDLDSTLQAMSLSRGGSYRLVGSGTQLGGVR